MSKKQLSINEYDKINLFEEALNKITNRTILIRFAMGITYIVKGKIILFSDHIKLLCSSNNFDFRLELEKVDLDEFKKILEFLEIIEWNKQKYMFNIKEEELHAWSDTCGRFNSKLINLCEYLRINHYFDYLKSKKKNSKNDVFRTVVDIVKLKKKTDDSFEEIDITIKYFHEAMPPKMKKNALSLTIPVDLSPIRINAANSSIYKGKLTIIMKDTYFSNLIDALICDSFWFTVCFFRIKNENDKKTIDKMKYDCENILKRISRNYFNMFISLCDTSCVVKKKDSIMNVFPDFISQCVYFSLFLSYPKSRINFNEEFKKRLISIFSYLYNGLTNQNVFNNDQWILDMGTGNIIENFENNNLKEEYVINLPDIKDFDKILNSNTSQLAANEKKESMSKLIKQTILNTPLYRLYAETNKFETLNMIKPINLSHRKPIELKDKGYVKIAKKNYDNVMELIDNSRKELKEEEKKFSNTLKEIKINMKRVKNEFKNIIVSRNQEYANYSIFLSS